MRLRVLKATAFMSLLLALAVPQVAFAGSGSASSSGSGWSAKQTTYWDSNNIVYLIKMNGSFSQSKVRYLGAALLIGNTTKWKNGPVATANTKTFSKSWGPNVNMTQGPRLSRVVISDSSNLDRSFTQMDYRW